MTPRRLARPVLFALPLLLGASAVLFWVRTAGRAELAERLAGAKLPLVAAMLAITACWISLRFVRWQFLLRRVGVRVPARPSLAIYLAGLLGTATPAYVGEIVRGVLLKRRFGVPLRMSTAVLIFERLSDVAGIALVAVLASRDARGVEIGVLFLVGAAGIAILLWPLALRAGLAADAPIRLRSAATVLPALALSVGSPGTELEFAL